MANLFSTPTEFSTTRGFAALRRVFSPFPHYGVMWTDHNDANIVVFYTITQAPSYHQLAQYLKSHDHWDTSFSWTRRRFYAYQRELNQQGHAWLLYEEKPTGWVVSGHNTASAKPAVFASKQFVPRYS